MRATGTSPVHLRKTAVVGEATKILLLFLWTVLPQIAVAKNPAELKPEDPTRAMIRFFDHHKIAMFGQIHSNKQEYEWLCELVKAPGFALTVFADLTIAVEAGMILAALLFH